MLPEEELLHSAERLCAHRLFESPTFCSVAWCAEERELKDDAHDGVGEKLLKREQSISNSWAEEAEL